MPNNIVKPDQEIVDVTWSEIQDCVSKIADWIQKTHKGDLFLYGIPNGGLIPTAMLSYQLKLRGVNARIMGHVCDIHHENVRNLIIIDDICDSGDTLQAAKTLFPSAKTATLYQRHNAKFNADYHACNVNDDRWLRFIWEVK